MYGLHQSLATQLYKLEHSCIVKIGDGHNYTCLEMDPDPETDGSFAEPEFACFSFSYEESSKLLKDRLHIPSSSFVDAGQTSDSGFTFDASQIIAAKGKWVPIRTGDYITHMAKIEAVHNWRDLEMNSNTNAERNQQNKEAHAGVSLITLTLSERSCRFAGGSTPHFDQLQNPPVPLQPPLPLPLLPMLMLLVPLNPKLGSVPCAHANHVEFIQLTSVRDRSQLQAP